MKTIGLLCGGKSAEHEISLISAGNILEAIDQTQYDVKLIAISQKGEWYYCKNTEWLPKNATGNPPKVEEHGDPVAVIPGNKKAQIIFLNERGGEGLNIDVFFPILHGPQGEDGTLQGLLELLDVPFVGPNTLGSAIGMDKEIMKIVLEKAGIPIGKYRTYRNEEKNEIDYKIVTSHLGNPLFIKPANMGSSVGVSKAETEEEFKEAIDLAFRFDEKIIIEEMIQGREIECAVLGNLNPKASAIGEITTPDGFYSYKAKYLDEKGAQLFIPAKLDKSDSDSAKQLALDTFKALCCEGLSRVDMFLTPHGKILVNEINTLPGFTKISMYPSLWQESGLTYSELISELIEQAIERYNRKSKLQNHM